MAPLRSGVGDDIDNNERHGYFILEWLFLEFQGFFYPQQCRGFRDHSVHVLSQWEMVLQCNVISHWLVHTQNDPWGCWTNFHHRVVCSYYGTVDILQNTWCIHPTTCHWGWDMGCVLWVLTHWGRDKMAAIVQTTFSNGFSWMKMYEFRLTFLWSLFPRVQLTIFQQWLR